MEGSPPEQLSLLYSTVLFLAAAVIAVPLSKRLGLGTVLGFLLAGVILGPGGLGFVSHADEVLHFSELGVVLLLFLIGLELQPARLWALRGLVFGWGALQVATTGFVLMLVALALGLSLVSAFIIGLVLALSSTAFALQLLGEKNQLATAHGQTAFGILLFQDLAAIPMLAIIPLLSPTAADATGMESTLAVIEAVAVITAVVVGGRLLLPRFFRLAASTQTREILTAASLLVVVGTALLVQQAGLSMALGAFLAGVLLAESEYRHELEADIEPFKGLLMGLFFMAVGMSVDLSVILREPLTVVAVVVGLLAIKAVLLYALGRAVKLGTSSSVDLALYISQGGEFAFVLFSVAAGVQVLDPELVGLLIVAVSLSMAATPLLLVLNEHVLKLGRREEPPPFDFINEPANPVVIAGFGRVGQVIARILRVKKIRFTALEASYEQVDFVRKYGNKIYFGDASRPELLRAAKVQQAKVFVLAIDDVEISIKTAEAVRQYCPNIKIYARARNRIHAYRLFDIGVDNVIRETFFSSTTLAREVLHGLGLTAHESEDAVVTFQRHDEALLRRQHAIYQDEAQLIASTKAGTQELQRLFEQDVSMEERQRQAGGGS
jgi:glutathione-regulated potassium-efflux system ancillary protein KefC/glutathione-regulated potassium-efflux system protein KefB